MPVKLRLRKQGRKKHPHYAIVAADSRAPRDGRFIEKIGFYDPVAEPGRVYVDHDAAIKWLQVGAQPTNTVRSLLRHAGVTIKFALIKQGKSEEEMERIYGRWRSEKDRKPKKKIISVTISNEPLEPIPGQEDVKVVERKALVKEEPAPEPVVEEVAEEATETATEEAPAAEETAPAAEEAATEEAPAAEEEKKEE